MVLLRYSTLNITIGKHLVMKIKYVFQRGDTCYWQRKIPRDLLDRYPASGPLKVNLKTLDPAVVSAKVSRLNREHEARWTAMRKDPTLTPLPAREEAAKLLKGFGVQSIREPDQHALEGFFRHLEGRLEDYADRQPDPEEAYRAATGEEYLTTTERRALEMVKAANSFLLSDALELYLKESQKSGQVRFAKLEKYNRRVWAKLIDLLGDKAFIEVTRDDAKAFRDALLAQMKTTSVRRCLNVVVAVFGVAILEKPIKNHDNVWEAIKISGEGRDATKRVSLEPVQMGVLRAKCSALDDDIRWALSIQLDAGTRIAEVIGLALSDIRIDGEETPYIDLKPHPWRTLKNDGSIRRVPLVGHALWAARRVLESAEKGQIYAFPRYIKAGECNSDSASSTLNKWMRSQGIDRTTHCFRHTMRDRLRDTGAPSDIQDAVGGWGTSSIGETYGRGYGLKTLHEALLKTVS